MSLNIHTSLQDCLYIYHIYCPKVELSKSVFVLGFHIEIYRILRSKILIILIEVFLQKLLRLDVVDNSKKLYISTAAILNVVVI